MAPEHTPELSLTDFVGLKEADDIDPEDRIAVIGLVCEVALSKEIEREKATMKREEQSKPAVGKGKRSQRIRVVKPSYRFRDSTKDVKKSSSEEDGCLDPIPISVWPPRSVMMRLRMNSNRVIDWDCETGAGISSNSGCGSLALQVIKSEDPAERVESEEKLCYSPEPISVWPPRPMRIRKHPKRLIEDYDDDTSKWTSNNILALQVTNAEDEVESEIHARMRKRTSSGEKKIAKENKPKKRPPPKPPANTGPEPPPALPESYRERMEQMGGTNPLLVIQKRLFSTDLTKAQNRLSIPITCVRNHQFLTEYEKAWLHSNDRLGHPNPIDVKIIDAEKVWDTKLRRWNMTKYNKPNVSSIYVLSNPWHRITKANDWIIGDLVQLWAFRVDGDLGFAIVKVEEDAAEHEAPANGI